MIFCQGRIIRVAIESTHHSYCGHWQKFDMISLICVGCVSHPDTLKCHSLSSSGGPTPLTTSRLPFFYHVAFPMAIFPFTNHIFATSDCRPAYILVHVLARSPPQTLGKDAERGTALRHWDAVSRQSKTEIHPVTWNKRQSRKHMVYLLFLALTEIQTAVTELQMWERAGSKCGCRHIVAAIFLPSACGYPA